MRACERYRRLRLRGREIASAIRHFGKTREANTSEVRLESLTYC